MLALDFLFAKIDANKKLLLYLKCAYCGVNLGIPAITYIYLACYSVSSFESGFVLGNFWFVFIFMIGLQAMMFPKLPDSSRYIVLLIFAPYVWLLLEFAFGRAPFLVNFVNAGLAYTLGVALAWTWIFIVEIKGFAGCLTKLLSGLLMLSIYINLKYYFSVCLPDETDWFKWASAALWLTNGIHNAIHYVIVFRRATPKKNETPASA